MATQTTYNATIDTARVGAIADTTDTTFISRNAEISSIGFGVPVAQGLVDLAAHKAKTGDAVILGITVRERSTLNDSFEVGDTMRVMTRGCIWVKAAVAVAAGDPVHVGLTAATFTNTGGVAIVGARYDSSAAADGLVKVRLA